MTKYQFCYFLFDGKTSHGHLVTHWEGYSLFFPWPCFYRLKGFGSLILWAIFICYKPFVQTRMLLWSQLSLAVVCRIIKQLGYWPINRFNLMTPLAKNSRGVWFKCDSSLKRKVNQENQLNTVKRKVLFREKKNYKKLLRHQDLQ